MKVKKSKRLESIKAAHELEKTRSSSRMEDYLEIISELVELKGYATTLDISRYMNVSAPSVTKMLQRLDEDVDIEVRPLGTVAAGGPLSQSRQSNARRQVDADVSHRISL